MVFLKFFLLTLLVLGVTPCGASTDYDITFYHVGQGNCTIVKSPTRRILFVDAGSSSTIGVADVNVGDEEGKYDQLAGNIVKFVKKDIAHSKWLYFVVSHPDQDHLNLVKPIISKSGFLDTARKEPLAGYSLGVLLGGDSHLYSKGEGNKLISFLTENKIRHWFGRDAYESEKLPGVFYVPKVAPPPLDEWDGRVEFLSVGMDSVYRKTPSAEIVNNASSIVMKLYCGSRSLMLTGDKTKKEMDLLISRFKPDNTAKLRSTILLATHHGSSDDFVQEWVDLTKPKHVIFSAGRSSFSHPRRDAFLGYATSRRLKEVEWHFVQFYGDIIDTTDDRLRSVLAETPYSEEKARGYVHAVTNYSVFVTGSQGNVRFITREGKLYYDVNPRWKQRHTAVDEFLTKPALPDATSIRFEGVYLDGISELNIPLLLQRLKTMNSLTELSLKGCLKDVHVDGLCELITSVPTLRSLDIKGVPLRASLVKQVKESWNNRGLLLEEAVASSDSVTSDDSGEL